ncbi:MAG: hypothetical protein V1875_05480 [Candidatus Altiarchaeota archaeon]
MDSAKGKDIVVVIDLMRHGPKAEAGNMNAVLSPEGERAALEAGRKLAENLPGDGSFSLKGYHTRQDRSKRTVELIKAGYDGALKSRGKKPVPYKVLAAGSRSDAMLSDDEIVVDLTPRKHPLFHGDLEEVKSVHPEGLGELQVDYLRQKYPGEPNPRAYVKGLPAREKEIVLDEAENYSVRVAIKNGDFSRVSAGMIAKDVLHHVQAASRLKSGSRVAVAIVGHEPSLSAFVKECVDAHDNTTGKSQQGFDTLEAAGGAFRPLETLRTVIRIDKDGQQTIETMFLNPTRMPGKSVQLNTEGMAERAKEYRARYGIVRPEERAEWIESIKPGASKPVPLDTPRIKQ